MNSIYSFAHLFNLIQLYIECLLCANQSLEEVDSAGSKERYELYPHRAEGDCITGALSLGMRSL